MRFLFFFFNVVCLIQSFQVLPQKEQEIPFKVYKLAVDDNSNYPIPKPKSFRDTSSFNEKTTSADAYWIRLDFTHELVNINSSNEIYLKFNTFDYGSIHYWHNKKVQQKPIGYFNLDTRAKKISYENYYSEIKISPKNLIEKKYIYLFVKRVTFRENVQNWRFSYSKTSFNTSYSKDNLKKLIPYYIFAGLCLVMWLSTLSFYVYLRKLEFLFYSCYLVILFFYVAGDILNINTLLFQKNHWLQHWWSQSLIIIANTSYGFFFIYYLRTKVDYPKIHKLMYVIMSVLLLTILTIVLFYLFDYLDGLIYINTFFMKVVYSLSILGLLYLAFFPKNNLVYFVIPASFTFLFSSLIHIYFADPNDGLLLNSRYYLLLGCILEIIIFTMGLNYKVHLEFKENILLQKKALAEKNKALRAQINPHFIFNALSSLQNLIIKNHKLDALKYLSNFSRLTRNVLESSVEPDATLDVEIKMLKDYLELESLRFSNKFTYKIEFEGGLDQKFIQIPFMITQPFVENAIIHGLLPKKEGKKELNINFYAESGLLVCSIDDTGVGRRNVQSKTLGRQKEKKSRGIEVSKLRLESMGKVKNNYQIIDKKDSNDNPIGTTVVLKFPL